MGYTLICDGKGTRVRAVLGLSLTSDAVAWVLLDPVDGTVLDHDASESHPGAELAGAAARGAHAIAVACGFELDLIRLTWTGDVTDDGVQLLDRLESSGLGDVEAVPMACALTVLVDPAETGITPRLALAYGAARAVDDSGDASAAAGVRPTSGRGRLHRRIGSAVLGLAAATAVLGFLGLSAGAAPPSPSPAATTTEGIAPAGAGWATVPAASQVTDTPERKVVDVGSYADQPSTTPKQAYGPAYIPVRDVPEAAPGPTSPTAMPHLSSSRHAMGPAPGPVQAFGTAPGPDIAELDDVFVGQP